MVDRLRSELDRWDLKSIASILSILARWMTPEQRVVTSTTFGAEALPVVIGLWRISVSL